MIILEITYILTPLQKLPNNVGDLGKLIVAKGFKKLPKPKFYRKTVGFSGIRTRIVRVKGKDAENLTTTTAQQCC